MPYKKEIKPISLYDTNDHGKFIASITKADIILMQRAKGGWIARVVEPLERRWEFTAAGKTLDHAVINLLDEIRNHEEFKQFFDKRGRPLNTASQHLSDFDDDEIPF